MDENSVERVEDKRVVNGRTEYYLKWKGYPRSENTWEPVDQLDCPNLIANFEESLKNSKEEVTVCDADSSIRHSESSSLRVSTPTPIPNPSRSPT